MRRKIPIAVLSVALATSAVLAAGRVVVMPDQQARPLQSIELFGAATNNGPNNLGDGSAVGEAYVWSFTPNPNVNVFDDGNLTGIVGSDRFIAEAVSFSLVSSTRESITWTLTVGGNPSSNTVTIDIVDPTDAISDTPLENLSVNVNISLKEGLKYIYQQQQVNGSWVEPNYSGAGDGAVTGFCTWAFENDGHVPTNNPDQDVYAEFVGKALGYLQGTATVQGTFAANADVPREAVAPATTDLNNNNQSQKLASADSWPGYSHPIATAAFLASLDTASYQTLVEDAVDYIGFMQSAGGTCSGDFSPCTQCGDCSGSFCSQNNSPCTQASDCQNYCSYYGNACTQNSDCTNFCSIYGNACTQNSDCASLCSANGSACTQNSDCGYCSYNYTSCTQDSDCAGYCSNNGSACTQNSDCSGYCSFYGNSCAQNSDCTGSYCSYFGGSCAQNSDCSGYCSFTGNACTQDGDCPFVGSGETCVPGSCNIEACNPQVCNPQVCNSSVCNTQVCNAQVCSQQACSPQQCTGPGGWTYNGPSNYSDYSINSWNWMALEGAASTSYAVDTPDWILQESECTLITHQTNPPDQLVGQPYGYSSDQPLLGHPNQGHATTCAGLSGLAAVPYEDVVPVGSLISAEPAPLDSIATRRGAALAWLGEKWNVDSSGSLGNGNRGNPYSHWTCCRGLRLTEASLGIPADSLTLVNGGVSFNWATGEENGSGNVPAPGSPREGYLPWIVRHQLPNGQWNFPAYTGTVLESCLNMLCLNPVVFGSCGDGTVVPPEQCDDGNTADGDGCSANCTFETPPCDDASVLPPVCDGLCPAPDECQFAPSLQRCACRPTLVTLEYFTAQVEAGGVRLKWKTTSETDNVGFRILLQRPKEGPVAISPLISSQGTDLVGAEYEYFDTSRKRRGKVYTYYLEDLDTQAVSTVRGEPVAVVIQDRLRPVVAEAPRSGGR